MEKAQTLRTRKGPDHGYRCRRCGQPKRGHICAALTQGERPEGDDLSLKAAALTALSAQRMQAVAAKSTETPKGPAPKGPAQALPVPPSQQLLGLLPSATARPFEQASPSPAVACAWSSNVTEEELGPIPHMDEQQLYSFLTDLDLSLSLEDSSIPAAALSSDAPATAPFGAVSPMFCARPYMSVPPPNDALAAAESPEMGNPSWFMAERSPTSHFPSASFFELSLPSMPVC